MRVKQDEGTRGSLMWTQRLVHGHRDLLERELRAAGALQPGETVDWVSPRRDDDWAEYRDAAFLEKIGHPELAPELEQFWPRQGPQWDALGRGSAGTVVLVEAKAHLPELTSDCTASETSRAQIARSMAGVKTDLAISGERDWLTKYYQYANRLAHLRFLQRHDVPACLAFVYFTNADMNGPSSVDAWHDGLTAVHDHLGLDGTPPNGVVEIFVDARTLA